MECSQQTAGYIPEVLPGRSEEGATFTIPALPLAF